MEEVIAGLTVADIRAANGSGVLSSDLEAHLVAAGGVTASDLGDAFLALHEQWFGRSSDP